MASDLGLHCLPLPHKMDLRPASDMSVLDNAYIMMTWSAVAQLLER